MDKFPKIMAIVAGVGFLGFGLWALAAPESFFKQVATFGDYHEHFIHDIGAFQIAIGSMLVLIGTMRDGLYAALAGATIGQGAHIAAHIMDADQGQNQATTIPFLSVLGGALLLATLIRARQIRG